MKKPAIGNKKTSLYRKKSFLGASDGKPVSIMAVAAVSALTAAAIFIPGLIVAKMQESRAGASAQGTSLPPGTVSGSSSGQSVIAPDGQARQGADPSGAGQTATHEAGSTPGGSAAAGEKDSFGAGQGIKGSSAAGKAASGKQSPARPELTALDRMPVRVYLTKDKRIEKVPMETYIRGVLAGEMPITFEPEALKAQAIAARTYIVRRLASGDKSGMPVEGADVTDTAVHQVYLPLKQLLARWSGKEREANLSKLNEAVQDTRGEIVTYNGSPIQALFFSTSNGYTENSEDYWDASLPYLRSVSSPWDKAISPEYKETTSMPLEVFYRKLGISGNTPARSLRVLDTTDGRRIRELAAGGVTFSGREAREKLGLASSQFTWKISGKNIEITTYGYGHGVGMSQWGADGMAQRGSTAYQILSHYYTGTKVVRQNDLPRLSS